MTPGLSDRFAQTDWQYLHGFAVFCDGAARHDDALLAENLGNLAVRERLPGVLGAHHLLDQRADRGARGGAAALGGDVTAEEILELEDAARSEHEFLGRHPRHRGF